MKLPRLLLLLLLILPSVRGDESTDIQQFNKLTDPVERAKLIAQAPPGEKKEMQKLDVIHKYYLRKYHGEAGLKKVRETQAAKVRGLGALEDVFHIQENFWEDYIAAVLIADEKAGVSIEKEQQDETQLKKEEDYLVRKRLDSVHTLVFNLAPSPEAFELEKRAKLLDIQMRGRQTEDSDTPYQPPITKEERQAADKQLDEIYTELQALPKLTPQQAQAELDAFTDDKVDYPRLWKDM